MLLIYFTLDMFHDEPNEINIKSSPYNIGLISTAGEFTDLFIAKDTLKLKGEIIGSINRLKKLPSGNYGVLDNATKHVFIFDSLGNYLHTIGGFGEGPGEYLYGSDFISYKRDSILVYDPTLFRLICFSENGEYSWMITTPDGSEHMEIVDNNLYLYSTLNMIDKASAFCYDLNTREKVFEFAWPSKFIKQLIENKNISIAANSNSIVSYNENLFLIHPFQFAIRKFSLKGKMEKIYKLHSDNFVPYDSTTQFNPRMVDPKTYFASIFNGIRISGNLFFLSYLNKLNDKLYLDVYSLNAKKINNNSLVIPDKLNTGNIYFPMDITPDGFFLMAYQPKSIADETLPNPEVIFYEPKF